MRTALFFLAIMLCFSPIAQGQLFKKLVDRTADKVAKRAEDKIVEGVSNELANRAMRPLDKAFDEIFYAQYEATYGEEWDDSRYEGDPEARSAAMSDIIKKMYGNVDLPEQYVFDYELDIKVYDSGQKKPNESTLLLSKEAGVMGATQNEDDEKMTMVYDFDQDYVAIFNEKEKTVLAMSGVMSMATSMAKKYQEKNAEGWENVTIKKTDKTKTIAGYQCDEYLMKAKDGEGIYCISKGLPIDWSQTWGKMAQQMTGNLYTEEFAENLSSGMLMEARMKDKSKKKKNETRWEVTKVSDATKTITTSDYRNAWDE